jgi:hypothetical protein
VHLLCYSLLSVGAELSRSDNRVVESDRCIPLLGKISFVAKQISDVLDLVLDHGRSLLRERYRWAQKKNQLRRLT